MPLTPAPIVRTLRWRMEGSCGWACQHHGVRILQGWLLTYTADLHGKHTYIERDVWDVVALSAGVAIVPTNVSRQPRCSDLVSWKKDDRPSLQSETPLGMSLISERVASTMATNHLLPDSAAATALRSGAIMVVIGGFDWGCVKSVDEDSSWGVGSGRVGLICVVRGRRGDAALSRYAVGADPML